MLPCLLEEGYHVIAVDRSLVVRIHVVVGIVVDLFTITMLPGMRIV